jgi:hypothetical protein
MRMSTIKVCSALSCAHSTKRRTWHNGAGNGRKNRRSNQTGSAFGRSRKRKELGKGHHVWFLVVATTAGQQRRRGWILCGGGGGGARAIRRMLLVVAHDATMVSYGERCWISLQFTIPAALVSDGSTDFHKATSVPDNSIVDTSALRGCSESCDKS